MKTVWRATVTCFLIIILSGVGLTGDWDVQEGRLPPVYPGEKWSKKSNPEQIGWSSKNWQGLGHISTLKIRRNSMYNLDI